MPRSGTGKAAGRPGTPALVALARAGVAHAVHSYDHDAAHPSYGLEAAEALGIAPERIFKTLVVAVDGRLVLGIVPVAGHLDLKALAAAAGGRRAAMADPADAQRATGYVLGGISPIGTRSRLSVVLDDTALGFDAVLVSAGRRGLEVELSPADLLAVTGGSTAAISS